VQMEERGIPRPGYPLWSDGQVVGQMTSGTQSPSLGIGIGLGYGPPTATPGMDITVEIRHRQVRARVVRPPFYRR
jgi:aminomethyltransferase